MPSTLNTHTPEEIKAAYESLGSQVFHQWLNAGITIISVLRSCGEEIAGYYMQWIYGVYHA